MNKSFCVYILTNRRNGTLYIGVTSNLVQRVYQHKKKLIDGFTKKYFIDKLVFFEMHKNANSAITREKQMKKWDREWKLKLIEKMNPTWKDLHNDIIC